MAASTWLWAVKDQQKLLRTQGFASGLQPGGSLTAATARPGSLADNYRRCFTPCSPHRPAGPSPDGGGVKPRGDTGTTGPGRGRRLGGPSPARAAGEAAGAGAGAAGRPRTESREPLPWRRRQSRAAALRAIVSIKGDLKKI